MMPRAGKQQGFAIVSSIILIVLLAMLGGFMATMSGLQHATTSRTLVAARAYYAAKAGLDWGIHEVIIDQDINHNPICLPSSTFYPAGLGLEDIKVTVTCVQEYGDHDNQGVFKADKKNGVFYIVSTAEFGSYGTPPNYTDASPDYVRRSVSTKVANF